MDRSLQSGVARPEKAREAVRAPAAPAPREAAPAPREAPTPREAVHRIPPRADAPVITDPAGDPVVVPAAQVSDEQLRMILDVSRLLAVPTDLDPLLCRIAEISCQLLNCERASIFLHDIVTGELWTKVAILSNEIRVQSNRGIVGHAFTQNCVVHVPEPYKDERFNPEPDRRTGFVTRNLLTAPMAGVDGKPLGVIQAVNKKPAKGAQKELPPARAGFGDNDVALVQLLAEQAGVAIQRHRLQLQAMEIVALRHEMDLARKTQQALIPKEPPGVPGIDAVGWTMPASTTGGDCFDLWRLPDGRLGILVADASGHGLGPALVVSQARTLIRALSDIETDPHSILARVNARMSDDLEWGQFVTAFLGFLSPDGELRWSSAGHGPIFFRPRAGAAMTSVDPPVQPLGVIPRWFDDAPQPVRLEPTGSLMLVSDGIFEATNVAHDQLGIERMCQTLDDHQHKPPTEVLAALRESVRRWHGKQDPLDDQTIVIVQREGSAQRIVRESQEPDGGKVPAGT